MERVWRYNTLPISYGIIRRGKLWSEGSDRDAEMSENRVSIQDCELKFRGRSPRNGHSGTAKPTAISQRNGISPKGVVVSRCVTVKESVSDNMANNRQILRIGQ